MENVFSQGIQIPCYDTDVHQLLKPVSFMNYAQEIANKHAEVLGFGFDDLQATHTVWVLSRMHIRFLQHPKWREKTLLETWHKGSDKLFYLRDFRMTDEQGNPLVLASTSWLIINALTRRITRDLSLDESGSCKENALEHSCEKLRMPRDLVVEKVAEHNVAYSDVDMNGHVNNAMYPLWAMDAIDPDVSAKKPLKELKINFNHEVLPGEKVLLYMCRKDDMDTVSFWVEGRMDGDDAKSAFIVELVF